MRQQGRRARLAKSRGKLLKKRKVGLQAVVELIEVGGAHPIAQRPLSCIRKFSGKQQAQQGGLARPVGPY